MSADVERHVKCWIRVTYTCRREPVQRVCEGDQENCITIEQANQICYGATLAARARNKTLAKAKTMVSIIK